MKLINGGIYREENKVFTIFCLLFIGINEKNKRLWAIMNIHRHRIKGMSSPTFFTKDFDKIGFTEEELKEKFNSDNWILLDGRLRIEKIDDMSFVDYPNGELENIENNNFLDKNSL